MGTLGVVGLDPIGDGIAGVVDAEEQGLVEKLVAHPAVERLGIAILHGLARGDVVPLHLRLVGPVQDRIRGELGAVVRHDHPGLPAPLDQRCQFARHPSARDRGVDDRRETLLRDIVQHIEDPEAASIGELVLHEIHRPSGVGHRLGDKRRAGAEGALAAPPSPDGQTLLAVEPLGALAVHHMAVATQDHVQPPIAEPPVLLGHLAQDFAQLGVIGSPVSISHRRSIHAQG